jgi:DNA-binding NarL/FixJ family response regulator
MIPHSSSEPCTSNPPSRPDTRSDTRQRLNGLTPREREVMGWLIQGKRNAEIATILMCSVNTIHKHVQAILRKLAVETRTAATHRALEAGFQPPQSSP